MGITPRLSRKLNETLGEEAAEDLVNWMDDVDAQRAEWREAMRADFAELRQEMQAGFAQGDAKHAGLRLEMQSGFAELRQEMRVGFATLRQEMAHLEAGFERRLGDLIKWSFVFWVGAVGAIAMLAGVLR